MPKIVIFWHLKLSYQSTGVCHTELNDLNLVKLQYVASKNSVKVTLRAKDYDPGQSN